MGKARCGGAWGKPGCGATIEWVQTENGKMMPIDSEPNPEGNVIKTGTAQRMVRGRMETVQTVMVVKPDDPTPLDRFMPHFATCPQAAAHKKPRSRA